MKYLLPAILTLCVLMSFDTPKQREEKTRKAIIKHYSQGFVEGKVDSLVIWELDTLTAKRLLKEQLAGVKSAIGHVTKLWPGYDKALVNLEEDRKKRIQNNQGTGLDDTLLRNYHNTYEKGKLEVLQYQRQLDSLQKLHNLADSVIGVKYRAVSVAYYRTAMGPNTFINTLELDSNYKVLEQYNSLLGVVRGGRY